MKKKILALGSLFVIGTITLVSSCSDINTVGDPHFNANGTLPDSVDTISMKPLAPSKVKFYVEVSGSMNGFFRANKTTDFKKDVWQILSYYSALSPEVTILTNDGSVGNSYPQPQFQTLMNTGAFVSSASTRVPKMLESIYENLNDEEGEVAVLISDMKYDPVGMAAPEVLLSTYSTDISKILGTRRKAISLIGAISDYLDKKGNVVADKSPYYYFVIGNSEQVAFMRNGISSMLDNNKRFIDNIESGFDYGVPACSFGIPDNCWQLDNETPTFVGYDPSVNDTCTIKMEVKIENYRWILEQEEFFRKAFKIKALYGSKVEIGNIEFDVKNITNKKLVRTAKVIVDIKLFNMVMDSDVLEWTLELPDTETLKFSPYIEDAVSGSDPTKSYSVKDFIKGIFYGGIVNKTLKPNYILISKES